MLGYTRGSHSTSISGRASARQRAKRAGTFVAHEVVGVGALRQEGEAEGMAFAQHREHAVDGARRCRLARPVAVEADDGLGREQPELIHLALGEGGAERGDDVAAKPA